MQDFRTPAPIRRAYELERQREQNEKRKKIMIGSFMLALSAVVWLAGFEVGHPVHKAVANPVHQLLGTEQRVIAGPTGARAPHPVFQVAQGVSDHVHSRMIAPLVRQMPAPVQKAARDFHESIKSSLPAVFAGCVKNCYRPEDYGCRNDGESDCTTAMGAALIAASKTGGTVILTSGSYFTGPIEMFSKTTLYINKGAELKFVSGTANMVGAFNRGTGFINWPVLDWMEYPAQSAYDHRHIYKPLIGGHGVRDVTITGGGTINGGGHFWWARGKEAKPHAPNGIHFVEGSNININSINLKDFPKFALRPQFCTKVRISKISISNPHDSLGTNGIVIDSCKDVIVEDSVVETGDKEDAIVVKSGKNALGRQRNQPSQDILVQRCTVKRGHAISVGSETSGGIRNVKFKGIEFDGRGHKGVGSMRIKTQRGRGGVVDGVTFEDIRGFNALYSIEMYMWYECTDDDPHSECRGGGGPETTPHVRNVVVRNVELHGVSRNAGIIEGLPEAPFENVLLENIHVFKNKKPWNCQKFSPGCTWPGGGCALGRAYNINPGLPAGCLRDAAPMGQG